MADHSGEMNVENHTKRNIGIFSATQALNGSSQAIIMSVGGLTGVMLAPTPFLATLPITAMIVGLAATAAPAAIYMQKVGRKKGFLTGTFFGMFAGLMACFAVLQANFWLFCFALVFAGSSAAFGQQYRFAAADSVAPSFKAKAISYVMIGGVLAGFFGPQMANLLRPMFPAAEFAGSYLGLTGMAICTFLLLTQTRLAPPVAKSKNAQGRSVSQLLAAPEILVPIVTGLVSYSLMTFVMVAAPLSMVHGAGHHASQAATAIQWHIIAMYAPSFVTGFIITKIGKEITIALGLILIMAAAAVALTGITVPHFNLALIFLGVGWNFGFIGSTALLTEGYRPEEAGRAQALNEFSVFGAMAIASVSSGILFQTVGWEVVNLVVFPLAAVGLGTLLWARTQRAASQEN